MYNLIITGIEDAWDGAPYELDLDRCVREDEYTEGSVSKRFGALDAAVCAELQALPTLFAYETYVNKVSKLGVLKRIRKRGNEARLEYEILADLPSIAPADILRLQWELGIAKLEMNRTHWAVKDRDLLSEMQEGGILTKEQADRYRARLASLGKEGVPSALEAVSQRTSHGKGSPRQSIFISYSHKDKKFLDELLTHIKPLQRDGRVSVWSDQQIKPGSKWLEKIESALARAKVALLLVTKDFLASDFINAQELGPLLKRAEQDGMVILWVLVRDCNWRKTAINSLQAAYPPDKPLAQLNSSRDSAWVKICDTLEKAADASAGRPVAVLNESIAPPTGQPPLELHAKGYYVEKGTSRKVCGLCWEKHSRRITLLDHKNPGPAVAVAGGGVMSGYASWTEVFRCPDCGTEYAPVSKSRDF